MNSLDPRRRADDHEGSAGPTTDPSAPIRPGSGTDIGLVARRVLAFLVDTVVLVAGLYGLARRQTDSSLGRIAITGTLAPVVGAVYHVLLEGRFGQTVGKRVSGTVVQRDDGTRPGFGPAARRTALRLVDWLPVAYLVGLASIWLTERDRRVGDLVAGTIVVRTTDDRQVDRD